MTPTQVVKHYGSITNAARELGFEYETVRGWAKGEPPRIPPRTQIVIESITGGKLKADKRRMK